jgi:hypothetical protein
MAWLQDVAVAYAPDCCLSPAKVVTVQGAQFDRLLQGAVGFGDQPVAADQEFVALREPLESLQAAIFWCQQCDHHAGVEIDPVGAGAPGSDGRLRRRSTTVDLTARLDQLQNLGSEATGPTLAIQALKNQACRGLVITLLGTVHRLLVESISMTEQLLTLIGFDMPAGQRTERLPIRNCCPWRQGGGVLQASHGRSGDSNGKSLKNPIPL